jgi:hypothetical protein
MKLNYIRLFEEFNNICDRCGERGETSPICMACAEEEERLYRNVVGSKRLSENINEGGKAVPGTRSIRQDEVNDTLDHIEEVVFPLLGLSEWSKDAILIGSAGKKSSSSDLSGDIDMGVDINKMGFGDTEQASAHIYDKIKNLGYPINYMKGLDLVSVAWPIKGDAVNGMVQLDFIPLEDIKWSKFAYHCPDYRKGESKYKSAHRNWLISAVLASIQDNKEFDGDGDLISFDGYMYRLNKGFYKFKKSFKGKNAKVKNAKIVPGTDKLVSKSPQKFVEFLVGPGYKTKDVETFESLWSIIQKKDFKWSENKEDISKNLIEFLERAKLQIPTEVK